MTVGEAVPGVMIIWGLTQFFGVKSVTDFVRDFSLK